MTEMPPQKKRWYDPFVQALRSGAFVFAHFSVALIFVATNYLIEYVLHKLGDPKLFDSFPWRYVFDGIDVALVLIFGGMGTLEAFRVFKGRPK